MFEINNLTVKYKFGAMALSQISLSCDDTGFFCILGEKESGKSTLLKTIAGLITPEKGEIYLRNTNLLTKNIRERNICLIHEDFGFFKKNNLQYNINYPQIIRDTDRKIATEKTNEIANKYGYTDYLNVKINKIPNDILLTAALSRCELRTADIFLIDNPFANFKNRIELFYKNLPLLRKLSENSLVIYSTNNYDEAEAINSKCLFLNYGISHGVGDINILRNFPPSLPVYDVTHKNYKKIYGKIFAENNIFYLLCNNNTYKLNKSDLLSDIFIGKVTICIDTETNTIRIFDPRSEKLIYFDEIV